MCWCAATPTPRNARCAVYFQDTAVAIDSDRRQIRAKWLNEPERVDFYLLMLVLEGSGWHTVDFIDWPLSRGQVLFVQPGQCCAGCRLPANLPPVRAGAGSGLFPGAQFAGLRAVRSSPCSRRPAFITYQSGVCPMVGRALRCPTIRWWWPAAASGPCRGCR
ncbi:MAG: AraC family ligand binding domain-containing protein [Parahaliea sp.]